MSEREKATQRGKAKADQKLSERGAKGKGKRGKGATATPTGASVATHPRAAAAVRRAKGFGGLGAFALALLISRKAGISHTLMLERALIAGVAGYLLVWALAVAVWRRLLLAQMEVTIERASATRRTPRTISLSGQPGGEPAGADGAAAPEAAS